MPRFVVVVDDQHAVPTVDPVPFADRALVVLVLVHPEKRRDSDAVFIADHIPTSDRPPFFCGNLLRSLRRRFGRIGTPFLPLCELLWSWRPALVDLVEGFLYLFTGRRLLAALSASAPRAIVVYVVFIVFR